MSLRAALERPILERVAPHVIPGEHEISAGTTIADLLAPDAIDRSAAGVLRAGASYLATLHVRSFPPTLALGWVGDPLLEFDLPGCTVHQTIAPVADATARRLLARSEDAAIDTLAGDARAGTHADVDAEQGMDSAAALRRDLASGADRMMRYSVAVTVSAASAAALAQRVAALQAAAARQGIALGHAPFHQWEGYLGALPLAREALGLPHDSSGRAAAMGLPAASPGLHACGGLPLVWGEHPRTGLPVIWDRWNATNPHALVIAESGSGKTYAMAGLIAQEVGLAGDALLILDPKFQEYRQLVGRLGGAYISLSRRAGFHINPLALPQLTPERAQIVAELEEDLLGQRVGVVKALLVAELRASGTPVDALTAALLERAICEVYDVRGITSDPLTFGAPMPTLGDVQSRLHDLAADEPQARAAARALDLFTCGGIGDLFNQQSNIPTDNPLLAIDLSPLLRSNDEVLARIIPVLVMDFFVGVALNRPTGRRSHLVLDEAHTLLHSEAGARALQTIYRIGRSMQFKATVITQSLADLDGSELTRVLLENAKTKLLLGLNRDSSAVARAAALLGLNEEEARYLGSCRLIKGVGATALLLADGERTPLLIPQWPPLIHALATGAAIGKHAHSQHSDAE